MEAVKFAVMGGDMRQSKLAGLLSADGHQVSIFAIDRNRPEGVTVAASLEEAAEGADCVVLPLPITSKEKILNTPLSDGVHMVEKVFAGIRPGQLVCAGRIGGCIYELAATRGLRLSDYYAREEMVIANAVATAEGAIQIAMKETPITLSGAKCLVIGFGRIGKILSHRLKGLGVWVTASARSYKDLAWIDAYGYDGENTEALDGRLGGYQIIFNTVPAKVLNEARLKELGRDCLCIDLSSRPGGMDFLAASQLGVKAIWALSLPGKVAPETSGIIIKNTIYNIMREQGWSL